MGLVEQKVNELYSGQSILQESNEVPDMDPETLNEQFRKQFGMDVAGDDDDVFSMQDLHRKFQMMNK
jgi:hypothetical protein